MIRIFLFCLMLAISMSGCGNKKAEQPQEVTEESHQDKSVHLKEESQKMIGLELISVQKKPLESTLEIVGEIAQETENVSHITSSQSGVLKSYLVKLGDVVEQGTPVCAIETKTGETVQIPSPAHGIVLAQYLKPNDSVDSLTSILTVANTDLLRASFNVYEKDLSGIKLGQKVSVKSIAYPNQPFEGDIVFISPSVDDKTRTIKIRVDVKNEEHLLKFGMFVTGLIKFPTSEPVLVLPENAIQNIKDQSVVFMPNANDKSEFLIQEVRTGRSVNDQVEVLEGVKENDSVIGKGSFYLKSELLKSELEEHD